MISTQSKENWQKKDKKNPEKGFLERLIYKISKKPNETPNIKKERLFDLKNFISYN